MSEEKIEVEVEEERPKTKIQQFQEELEKFSSEEEAKAHLDEIAQKLGVSKTLGRKALKRITKWMLPEERIVKEAKEPILKIERPEEIAISEEEEEGAIPEIPVSAPAVPVSIPSEGYLTQEDIKQLFIIINDNIRQILGKEYAPSDESANILAKLGFKPLNRLVAKYLTENIDLYIFLVAIAGVYMPPIAKYYRDKRLKKE